MRSVLVDVYLESLRAVDPRRVVAEAIHHHDATLTVGSHTFNDVAPTDVVVVALGKAARGMAQGAFDAIGTTRGLVVASSGGDSPFAICVGSHPIPDARSLACGETLLHIVERTKPSDVVVFLVSGGGSALAVVPTEGASLEDVVAVNRRLIASGLPIEEINAVRAAVSGIKGGRLADATVASRQVTLIMSDVVGAGPQNVASGPTLGLEPHQTGVLYDVVGSPGIVARAAAIAFESRGFDVSIVSDELMGNARDEARALVASAKSGTISIAAGETTVEVVGNGVGGRNQDAALAVAVDIAGTDVTFAAIGTDGIDGPTDAAGAIVDGHTVARADALGIDLGSGLANNDSHTVLSAVGATVVTGPSGTNVADLWMAARGPF